jgi:chorismate mutase/prephenate dehydrogenase
MTLDELRQRLTEIDAKILDLVAERQSVVDQIGSVKLDAGQATRDFAREKQVLDIGRERALRLGISPELAKSLLEQLIRSSLTNQEQARVRASGHGKGRQALVIGGAGKMGRWFVSFLDSQGFAVTIADPREAQGGFSHLPAWQDATDDFDVTVIATPIGVSAAVLDEIAAVGRKGLIFDVGSLKTPLVPGLRKLAEHGAQITSLHPMFGPDTDLLSGRHVLFLDAGAPDATRAARELFSSTMAEQIEMKLEDHDRMIAYILGLSHALNIAFFTALAKSGEDLPQLADLSSTTFDAQLNVARKVSEESPELYFEIQRLNPHGLQPLRELSNAITRISEVVEQGDEQAFIELMRQGREYFANR